MIRLLLLCRITRKTDIPAGAVALLLIMQVSTQQHLPSTHNIYFSWLWACTLS